MNKIQNGEEMRHHGILGMKWGVRRENPSSGGRGSTNRSKNEHDDYLTARSKKSIKTMSDNELRKSINRLQMEQQYSKLTQNKKSAGFKFVQDVLTNAAKQTATQYVSKYMTKGIDEVIKRASHK